MFCLFAVSLFFFLPSFLIYLFVLYILFNICFSINCFISDSNELCVVFLSIYKKLKDDSIPGTQTFKISLMFQKRKVLLFFG